MMAKIVERSDVITHQKNRRDFMRLKKIRRAERIRLYQSIKNNAPFLVIAVLIGLGLFMISELH